MKATGGFFTNREAQEALIGKFSARTQANARAVVNMRGGGTTPGD